MKTFRQDLEEVINKHSMENGSNTPDFMLAEYLTDCLRAFDKVMKRRDLWYKKHEWENQPQDYKDWLQKIQDTTKKLMDEKRLKEEKLRDEGEFNNLCARATLYPGKSIEEVQDIQYMERLETSYKFINSVLLGTTPMNDKKTRQWVTKTLAGRLSKYGVVVKCNGENNPPNVIDQNLLLARVMRTDPKCTAGFKYVDLLFGELEQVKKYTDELLINQRLFNFIEKGI